MSKKCRECGTVFGLQAPYCDACGCQFSKVGAIRRGLSIEARYRLASVLVGVGVAVLQFFRG